MITLQFHHYIGRTKLKQNNYRLQFFSYIRLLMFTTRKQTAIICEKCIMKIIVDLEFI